MRSAPLWVPSEQRFRFAVMGTGGTPGHDPARWYTSADGVQFAMDPATTALNSSAVPGLSLYHVVYDAKGHPSARFKSNIPPFGQGLRSIPYGGMAVSADGVAWKLVRAGLNITTSDEQSLSLDPNTGRFIYTVKRFGSGGRAVALATTTDFYAEKWDDLGVVFGTDEEDQAVGREEIRRRLGDKTRSQPMCAFSAAERNTTLVPEGACYNATCPNIPRCRRASENALFLLQS